MSIPCTIAAGVQPPLLSIDGYDIYLDRRFSSCRISPEAWDSLLEKSFSNLFFMKYHWFKCWATAFHMDDMAFVLSIYRGDRLIGIAPLMLQRTTDCGVPYRYLCFMAEDDSDYLDLICAIEDLGTVAYCVAITLAQHRRAWDVLRLSNIQEDSPSIPILAEAFSQAGLPAECTILEKCHQIKHLDVAKPFTNVVLARTAEKVRIKRKKLQALGAITFTNMGEDDDISALLESFFVAARVASPSRLAMAR